MNDNTDRPDDTARADGGTELASVTADQTNELSDMPDAKQEFLLEAVRRAPLLRSLQAGSRDISDLSEVVDMSRSTIHRAISSLEDQDVVEKSSEGYQLTTLGKVLAEETEAFGTRAWTTFSLKQFLNAVNLNGDRFPVNYFADADITRRTARQPHRTIHRITKLFEDSDSLRMFSTVISPVYVDVGYREMMNGMHIEAIFDHEVVDIMLSEFPEKAYETIETGNFDVHSHDGVPFELFIFDDKVGMAAHNENGNAEILIECDDSAAIEWAETLYDQHLSEADPLALSDS